MVELVGDRLLVDNDILPFLAIVGEAAFVDRG
jgi:hypothetical protein